MIVGRSKAIERARQLIERYAPTPLAILVMGPTGAGKELVAREIHRRSGRPGSLIDVNCAALPRELAESLLFGHRRGAFTGARDATTGYVALADRGTLFLDELGSFPLDVQPKLLRVLETWQVPTLGADTKRTVEVRVVGAAQEELFAAVRTGRFRRDLFQRLAGVVIDLPPIVERMEDVVPIAEHFARASGRTLEPGVASVLEHHSWPGNVREVRFVIERASYLVSNGTLSPGAVSEAIALGQETVSDHRSSLQDIIAAGVATGWNAARMATVLRIHRATLFRRLSHDGLTLRSLKESHESHESHESRESRDRRATGATLGTGVMP
jgi:transcriptional regulator with PAS, ATPase and Fis domain